MRRAAPIVVAWWAMSAAQAVAHPVVTACERDETVVFACDLADRSSIAVCLTEASDTHAHSLVYRASGKTIAGGLATHAAADGAFFLSDLGSTKGRVDHLRFVDRGRDVVVYSGSSPYEGNTAGVAMFEGDRRVAHAPCVLPNDEEPWPIRVPPSLAAREDANHDRLVSAPGWTDFPAGAAHAGPPAPLDESSADARMFRTRLREALARPADFAGEYVIALWGCGSGCLSGAAVNRSTGKAVFLPGTVCCWDGPELPLRYRLDSRVLVIDGVVTDGRPGWDEPVVSTVYRLGADGFEFLARLEAGARLPDESPQAPE
jgi:hypothetical protein